MVCLPKAELGTKNSLVESLVFNSIAQLISLPTDEVYPVGNGGPDHAVVLHMSCSDGPKLLLLLLGSTKTTYFTIILFGFHFAGTS